MCFEQRHTYHHYLHADVPGPRPPCFPILPDDDGSMFEPDAALVVMLIGPLVAAVAAYALARACRLVRWRRRPMASKEASVQ